MSATPVLELVGAQKSYGAVHALQGVDLKLWPNEVLGLLGDNGAGKSTLIKALSGAHQIDRGTLLVDGREVHLRAPADAREIGIETVYQDLALFDNLSPIANFFAGREQKRCRWLGPLAILDERGMHEEWERLRTQLGVNIHDSRRAVGTMSGGQRQAAVVARAVSFAKRVVILDEPTAALGVRESGHVLELIERLPQAGLSAILISHNLDDVIRVANRAVVMRHGRIVGEVEPRPETYEEMVSLIVGSRNAHAR